MTILILYDSFFGNTEQVAQAIGQALGSVGQVGLAIGDAANLPIPEQQFDAAVLNLILSVVPDGAETLRETLRCLIRCPTLGSASQVQPHSSRKPYGIRP